MTIAILLLTCILLTPWLVQFGRYVITQPEAIPTPTWMVTSSVAFLYLFPLIGALFNGESIDGHDQAAVKIMITTLLYWITFTGVYMLASGRLRTVEPSGPRGIPTSFGVLKHIAKSTPISKALIVFVPLIFIRVYFLATTGLGVSGSGLAILNLPYHLVVLRLLTLSASSAFTALFAVNLFGTSRLSTRIVAAALIGVQLIFAVIAGRRPVLNVLGLIALGVLWSGKKRHATAILLMGVSAWFLFFVFSPIFLRARAIWRRPNGPSVVAAFRIAVEQSAERGSESGEGSAENIKHRLNTYTFWLDFYDANQHRSLGGTLLIQSVVMTIPRALSGFSKYAFGATEEAVFGTDDISNNVCLASYIDLGAGGPLVYGVIFGLIFAMIDRAVIWMSCRNKYMALVAIGGVYGYLVSPEADLMGYMGTMRQILILMVLTFLTVLLLGAKPLQRVCEWPRGRLRAAGVGRVAVSEMRNTLCR